MTYCIHLPSSNHTTDAEQWHPHPKFDGVQMQDMLTSDDTNGAFSTHLVQVAPHKSLFNHSHPNNWETHHILAGNGTCKLGAEQVSYGNGTGSLIPIGCEHEVTAGADGLLILAVFTPALK